MNVLMVRAKIKEENVDEAKAAIEQVIQALEQAQPAGVQYASCLLADGVTFIALLKLEDDGGHLLRDLPAYAEMVEDLKQWHDGPPAADRMTVTGSYGLF
jgi:thioredoxin-like negative regulator of GroEL